MPMGNGTVKIHRGIFLLSLLSANNSEPIKGRTKLEKLLFLIRNEILANTHYEKGYYVFEPYKFGPFTADIFDDVILMEDLGYITKQDGREDIIYRITEKGEQKLHQIYQKLPKDIHDQLVDINKKIEKLKKEKNKLSLSTLLSYVYQRYPLYTINSEIKESILY